jgi:hypothetical protein
MALELVDPMLSFKGYEEPAVGSDRKPLRITAIARQRYAVLIEQVVGCGNDQCAGVGDEISFVQHTFIGDDENSRKRSLDSTVSLA